MLQVNDKYKSQAPKRLKLAGLVAVALATMGSAQAFQIDSGNEDTVIRWDNTIKFNAAARIKSRDSNLSNSPGNDDSSFFADKGEVYTARFDLLSEFDVKFQRDSGFRISAAAWYDPLFPNASSSNPALAAFAPSNYSTNLATGASGT